MQLIYYKVRVKGIEMSFNVENEGSINDLKRELGVKHDVPKHMIIICNIMQINEGRKNAV